MVLTRISVQRVLDVETRHRSARDTRQSQLSRETLLQALRGVLAGAGQKMGEPVRKSLTDTLLRLLGDSEVNARTSVFRRSNGEIHD